jgi:hypothetical protein
MGSGETRTPKIIPIKKYVGFGVLVMTLFDSNLNEVHIPLFYLSICLSIPVAPTWSIRHP